jgi:hypothetical protein
MTELRRLSDITIKLLPFLLAALIYWFGVVKNNEYTRTEIVNIKAQVEILNNKCEKLDDVKADIYTMEIVMKTLDRIDAKIDKLQEQIINTK